MCRGHGHASHMTTEAALDNAGSSALKRGLAHHPSGDTFTSLMSVKLFLK